MFNGTSSMLGGPLISNSSFGGCASASAVVFTVRSGFSFHRTCSSQCPKRQTWNKVKKLFWILKKKNCMYPALTVLLQWWKSCERALRWLKVCRRCPLRKDVRIYLMILSQIIMLAPEKTENTEHWRILHLVKGGWARVCAWEVKSYAQHLWLVISLIMHWSKLVTYIKLL